jgi:hypothetical protein
MRQAVREKGRTEEWLKHRQRDVAGVRPIKPTREGQRR